jgi:uncharacterized membrane protein
MQKLKNYLKEVIIGGIYLIFPLTLLIYVILMAHDFVSVMIRPLSNAMPDIIPGFDGSYLLAAFILVQLCFLGGVLLLNKNNRSRFDDFERKFLMGVPGYNKLKLAAALMIGDTQNDLSVVSVRDGDSITLGVLMDSNGEWCTVFIPESPDASTGSVVFFHCSAVTTTDIRAKDLVMVLKSRGMGSSAILGKLGRIASPATQTNPAIAVQSDPDGSTYGFPPGTKAECSRLERNNG